MEKTIRYQTMKSWPKEIKEPSDLPAELTGLARALSGGLDFTDPAKTILLPPQSTWFHKEPAVLLRFFPERVEIAKKVHRKTTVTSVRWSDLRAIEVGELLLISWVRLVGDGLDCWLMYNTVGAGIMMSFIFPVIRENIEKSLRIAGTATPTQVWNNLGQPGLTEPGASGNSPDPFEILLHKDYKFHSFAGTFIKKMEVKEWFYHPHIEAQKKRFSRQSISSYLFVHADDSLFTFSAQVPSGSRYASNYTMIVRWIPGVGAGRAKFQVSTPPVVQGKPEQMSSIRCSVSDSVSFSYTVSPDQRKALTEFLERVG